MQGYARYAIFYAPEADGALGRFGNAWLGFDPASGDTLPRPKLKSMGIDEISRLTKSPSRYGFHATLKPPFVLTDDYRIEHLDVAVEELAINLETFAVPAFRVDVIDQFVALVPGEPNFLLDKLAATCVRELDNFRAPQDESSLRLRRQAGLTDRQEELLKRWGYPYVLDDFRFHLSLSGSLDNDRCARLRKILQNAVPVDVLPVGNIALFGDPGDGRRFRLLKRYPLG